MKNKKILASLLSLVSISVLSGCASTPKDTNYVADKVVARSDDLSSRPKWVSETVSVRDEDDHTNFIGVAEVPGDSRTQAAFKMSDAAARGFLANKIKTTVTKVVQSTETGLSMDDQQLNSLIQEVSQTTFHNVDVKDRYWEKVEHTEGSGSATLRLKTFSLITIPKTEVKKMVMDAVDESKKDAPAHSKLKSALNENWNSDWAQ